MNTLERKKTIKRFARCYHCAKNKVCFVTENNEENIEYYCEHCHAIVPVRKLITRSRKNISPNFVGNARYSGEPAKRPRFYSGN